jgi:hypothetical protein
MRGKPDPELQRDAEILVGAILLQPRFLENLYQHRDDPEKIHDLLVGVGIEDPRPEFKQALLDLDWVPIKAAARQLGLEAHT